MADTNQSSAQHFRGARAIDAVADFLADPVAPAAFPKHKLRYRNDAAASEIGLATLSDAAWVAHFGRFEPLPDSLPQPLALRYHGHQFRSYNPDIGDGRGFLFGQCRDADGRLLDFGTKGSGQTPYSRFGDGRLTLKGAVREILATEMLEALGVHSSRTFSVIETGEALQRGDEPSPTRSAVLVRLSHGHIRIGSFQRLATLSQPAELGRLIDYVLQSYFNETGGPDAPARLLAHVVRRTARLAASYMAAGFVHGVLNTDNINVTGESFDYGPWRFAPSFDGSFTAAYFDQHGLYAFARQAEAIHWNLVQLAIALRPLADSDALAAAIEPFGQLYVRHLVELMLWRLGVAPRQPAADIAAVQALERALTASQAPLDQFFFDWRGGRPRRGSYPGEDFVTLERALAEHEPLALDHDYWSDPAPCGMLIEEVEALWTPIAERDEWTSLYAKVAAIRRMGEALAKGGKAP